MDRGFDMRGQARWGLALCAALSIGLMAGLPVQAQTAETDDSKICAAEGEEPRIRLGVRRDAPPFSYFVENRLIDQGSDPYAGYTVELCTGFVGSVQNATGLDDYCFKEVDPKTRFEALDRGEIDLLCGATTASVAIRAQYRTSLMTYLAVSGMAYLRDGPVAKRSLGDLSELRLGVRAGTTSQDALANEILPGPLVDFLESGGLKTFEALERVEFENHRDVPGLLRDGEIDIYLADRPIVEAILSGVDRPADFEIFNRPIALQPYSVIIAGAPFGSDRRAGVDLQHNFDRYLIEEKFAPEKIDAFLDRLRVLLPGGLEPFFVDFARMQGVFP